jgi:hypothetical protein
VANVKQIAVLGANGVYFAWSLDSDDLKIELWQQKGPAPE